MVSWACDAIDWRRPHGLGYVRAGRSGNPKRGRYAAHPSFSKMDIGGDYGCVSIARRFAIYRRRF